MPGPLRSQAGKTKRGSLGQRVVASCPMVRQERRSGVGEKKASQGQKKRAFAGDALGHHRPAQAFAGNPLPEMFWKSCETIRKRKRTPVLMDNTGQTQIEKGLFQQVPAGCRCCLVPEKTHGCARDAPGLNFLEGAHSVRGQSGWTGITFKSIHSKPITAYYLSS